PVRRRRRVGAPRGHRRGPRHRGRVRAAPAVARRLGRRARGVLPGPAIGIERAGRRAMSFALVFSGQGMQHPAMLPWLHDDTIVRSLCTRLRVADWRKAAADAAWTERNAHAQVLLTGLALSAWQQLAPRLP